MLKKIYAFFLSSLLFVSTALGQPTGLHPAGQVVWVKGSVKAIYPEQAARVLARGALVYDKDTLITDTSSSGEVAFTDNSLLSLRPGSTFVIENYHFDQTKPTTGSFVMNLIEGGFRTITGFIAKAQPDNYQVKTPVATIGVRGTSYQANCANGECVVGLEKGTGVSVSNNGGTIILTPENPYAHIVSSNAKPALSNEEPAILARPPDVLPPSAPPPAGANPTPGAKGGAGNCGILVN